MSKGSRIRALREAKGLTQDDLARLLNTTKQTISKYENNVVTNIPSDKVETMAEIFETSPDYILGWNKTVQRSHRINEYKNLIPMSQMPKHKIPLIGSVAAGEPIIADPEYDVYIDSPEQADYALTVEGDSMEPLYLNGDVVYIKEQPDVDDGRVAVVLLDDSAALKHVYHAQDGLLLVSENTKYPPKHASFSEYDNIRILGVVVGFTRMYK